MLDIKNLTKNDYPKLPYQAIVQKVFGEVSGLEISLVFIGEIRSKSLNRKFRSKDKPANILSFPFSPISGEIFIDLKTSERWARKEGLDLQGGVKKLFIHGLLHLKGFDHGGRMEELESQINTFFTPHGQKYHRRTRRGDNVGKARNLRGC